MMNLKEMFQLSDRGVKDLKKGIIACTLTNLSIMLSVAVTIQIFIEVLKPLAAKEISWSRMWLLFAAGIVSAVIHFLCSRNDYRKTYVSCYTAAEDSRIRIAELVRKIPMSVFNDKEPVLQNVTVKIPEGKITALVGASGSGKSTMSKLIARFWDVNSGKIMVGGVDIKTLDPEYLMGYMAFVFQDVTLFHDTILNNIRIGNMEATDEKVIAAAKAACCDEFIRKLSDGYHTVLGENGDTLSGGERQRISIARALLKAAPIVLLDEATASLDPENEVRTVFGFHVVTIME